MILRDSMYKQKTPNGASNAYFTNHSLVNQTYCIFDKYLTQTHLRILSTIIFHIAYIVIFMQSGQSLRLINDLLIDQCCVASVLDAGSFWVLCHLCNIQPF